ncbi:MAG: hypothetical protein AAGB04_22160 [Pseudomonadota bacterium]
MNWQTKVNKPVTTFSGFEVRNSGALQQNLQRELARIVGYETRLINDSRSNHSSFVSFTTAPQSVTLTDELHWAVATMMVGVTAVVLVAFMAIGFNQSQPGFGLDVGRSLGGLMLMVMLRVMMVIVMRIGT